LSALKGKSSFDDWWNVMKSLKVGKCLLYLKGEIEVLIEERHNKCQKMMSGAKVNKIRRKQILNYEHVFWYL
jgi:hypothetical protein